MASKRDPAQIIRKDGNSCFVEVMSNSFEIGKVLLNFYTYDTTAQAGSRLKNGINIYLSFEEFYRLCNDIAVTRSLLSEILKMAQDAQAQGKTFAPMKTIYQGGRSAESLSRAGQARPDGMSLARQLKIQSGSKYPVILIAESGPGEQDQKGLIVPRYQQPECKVTIPFTYDSIKELFLIAKAHVDAFLAAKYTYWLFHPEENPMNQNRNNSNEANGNYPRQNNGGYQQRSQYQPKSYQQNKPQGYNSQQSQSQQPQRQQQTQSYGNQRQQPQYQQSVPDYSQSVPPPIPDEYLYGNTPPKQTDNGYSQFKPPVQSNNAPPPQDIYDDYPPDEFEPSPQMSASELEFFNRANAM